MNRKELRELFHDKSDAPANALFASGGEWRMRGLVPLDMRSESRHRGNGLDDGWTRADFNDSEADRNRSQDDGYAKDALPERDAASYRAWLRGGHDPARLVQQAPCMRHAARMIEQAAYELAGGMGLIVPDALFPASPSKVPELTTASRDGAESKGLAALLLVGCTLAEAEAYWQSELCEIDGSKDGTARAAVNLGRSVKNVADARSRAAAKLEAASVPGGLREPDADTRGRILERARVAFARVAVSV